MDAIPIPNPPISRNMTSKETDSGRKDGNPDPPAEMVKSNADRIREFFLPNCLLTGPANNAPTKHPKRALPTTQPFKAAERSKYSAAVETVELTL